MRKKEGRIDNFVLKFSLAIQLFGPSSIKMTVSVLELSSRSQFDHLSNMMACCVVTSCQRKVSHYTREEDTTN